MARAKNNAFNALPQFIWGEAVSEAGFTPQDYLIHTRYPRFIAKVYDALVTNSSIGTFKSQLGQHPETGELIYVTDFELGFKDWVFLDSGNPDREKLKHACDAAVLNYMMRDDEYGINED